SISNSLNLLNPKFIGQGIKFREDRIQISDKCNWGQARRDLCKPDQITEQNGHGIHPVGDDSLATIQTPDNLTGQDIAEQCLRSLFFLLNSRQILALAIVPLLAFQRSIDPGPKKDRIKRFRQVILGTSLNTPN